jgi:hypothetical protein|tara:strand:- start:48 stop:455 length:408 start_codon:yes stop_codon:yes gene_type:complete
MKKLNENLSDLLDIPEIETIEEKQNEIVPVETGEEISNDAQFARQNIKGLITKGDDALDSLLRVAKESEHPRAFEVVAQTLKNLGELNKDLLEVQKRKRDLEPKKTSSDINVDKAVFVGSTNDLVKMLKGKRDAK